MAVTLIDFYADWCGPCKMMKPVVASIKTSMQGKVEVKEVDVEAQTDMAAQYGVMSIPTFVILKDEKEVDRRMGAMPEQVMVDWINSHLQ